MFLFSFRKFPGFDKKDAPDQQIFSFDRVFYSRLNIGKAGDLLQTEDDILLNLGDNISYPEMYRQIYPDIPMKIRYSAFFDQHFLSFLHWMVYERYSSYKNVMKYFVNIDLPDLLQREKKIKKADIVEKTGQTLVVFPDVWTRENIVLSDTDLLHSSGDTISELVSLSSLDSQNQKDIHRWQIKKGAVQTVLSTHSEVFQPFSSLTKIILYDREKWYYNNQQDPRYNLPVVIEKMSEIYGAEVVFR
ncbi:hypothetical protein AGMMS50249_6010 [candidate division SR1 bacterium]|nr:hypothetical protein AGMMS50249_6010 [candidate division SR1 bacterium]